MDVVYARCAGLDIHKVAQLPPPDADDPALVRSDRRARRKHTDVSLAASFSRVQWRETRRDACGVLDDEVRPDAVRRISEVPASGHVRPAGSDTRTGVDEYPQRSAR